MADLFSSQILRVIWQSLSTTFVSALQISVNFHLSYSNIEEFG